MSIASSRAADRDRWQLAGLLLSDWGMFVCAKREAEKRMGGLRPGILVDDPAGAVKRVWGDEGDSYIRFVLRYFCEGRVATEYHLKRGFCAARWAYSVVNISRCE